MKDTNTLLKIVTYKPIGNIDTITWEHIRYQLLTIVEKNYTDPVCLVVDMKEVSYMDCKGVSVLLAALRDMHSRGGTLVLQSLSFEVQRVLIATGTIPLFDIQDGQKS